MARSVANKRTKTPHPRHATVRPGAEGGSVPLLFRLPAVDVPGATATGTDAHSAPRESLESALPAGESAYYHTHAHDFAPHWGKLSGGRPADGHSESDSGPALHARNQFPDAPFHEGETSGGQAAVGTEQIGLGGRPAAPSPAQARGAIEVAPLPAASWWDHWSSGVVVILLIIVLVTLALIAMNRTSQPKPSLLAEFGVDPTGVDDIPIPDVEGLEASVAQAERAADGLVPPDAIAAGSESTTSGPTDSTASPSAASTHQDRLSAGSQAALGGRFATDQAGLTAGQTDSALELPDAADATDASLIIETAAADPRGTQSPTPQPSHSPTSTAIGMAGGADQEGGLLVLDPGSVTSPDDAPKQAESLTVSLEQPVVKEGARPAQNDLFGSVAGTVRDTGAAELAAVLTQPPAVDTTDPEPAAVSQAGSQILATATPDDNTDALLRAYQEFRQSRRLAEKRNRYQEPASQNR
ncbi:MAG: hypothetical protein D6753_13885 [Planctomycetota bacterium]|nr:MAG: hypothetical protein D6753_13885 [Planctomycetota bacterium]